MGMENCKMEREAYFCKTKSKEKRKRTRRGRKKRKRFPAALTVTQIPAMRSQRNKKKKKKKPIEDCEAELRASIAEVEEERRRREEERKKKAPMTKEEWEKKQSVVRREFDEDTGRVRLIKGDGEVLEECVSRERQQEINRAATRADGVSFQRDVARRTR